MAGFKQQHASRLMGPHDLSPHPHALVATHTQYVVTGLLAALAASLRGEEVIVLRKMVIR